MEKRIFIVCGVLLITVSLYAQPDFDDKLKSIYKNTIPIISTTALDQSLQRNNNVILLDTRTPKEFEVSHLPGAYFLDYDHFTPSKVEKIDRSTTIIVYCTVGYRSERIGEKLRELGFTNVYNLYGGITQWKNDNKMVVNMRNHATDSVHTYNQDWSRWLVHGIKVY
ncbi:MAG: rhodanese-like domain-containing protein [Cyclobacteriaceae bacterium]|nr:rhodanese-like domain-containing protein [Cyclobacteriaceae bacterium]